jgi:hypothetical protein
MVILLNSNIKNKKAWLRIAEAFIAILLILSVILIVVSKHRAETNRGEEIARLLASTLDSISKDENLRGQILSNNTFGVNETIEKIVPFWMAYSTRICSYDDICSNPTNYSEYESKNVYSDEIIVAANLTYRPQNATKLKVFFWER